MWELFEPDLSKKNVVSTFLDLGLDRPIWAKRFCQTNEDLELGIRILVEGNTPEELDELLKQVRRRIYN